MGWQLGGKVKQCEHREYGFAKVQIAKLGNGGSADALFEGLGDDLEVLFHIEVLGARDVDIVSVCRCGCRMETN